MKDDNKIIYRYSDDISFRQCSLAHNEHNLIQGDCTNFYTKDENWKTYYYCNQYGIHLHCTKHPEIELEKSENEYGEVFLKCQKCRKSFKIDDFNIVLMNCMKMLNINEFKDAKLIRLDDWYIPEIKEKKKLESDYWITTNVKVDKDGDTIIVLYIGKKNDNEKIQFFIKPEKLQLSSDYKDLDPATILSKIEVTLRDRKLKQEYDEKD